MRDLAISLFMMTTLPMAFVRPVIGLLLWVLFSYMNPHRLAFGFAFGFPWVMLAAIVTLISLFMHPEERQKIPRRGLTVVMLLFLLWTGVTTLTAVKGSMAQGDWVSFLKSLVMAFAILALVKDRQRLHWLIWVIVISFGFWGLKSGVFTVLTAGSFHVFGPRGSFFQDNNDYALVMCMTLPLMRYLQLQATSKWVRAGFWALMALTALSVLGTYSRGGFLALGVVTLMLVFKSRRRLGLLLAFIVLVPVLIGFMPQKWVGRMHTISHFQHVASAEGRIQSWKFATNVALARPIRSGGFDVWASDSMWNEYGPPGAAHRAIHSVYFEVLGEQGFIGLGLYLLLFLLCWRNLGRIRRSARASPDSHWMADLSSMLQVSLVAFLAAGVFLPMAYLDPVFQIFALTIILQVLAKRELARVQANGKQPASAAKPGLGTA